MARAATEPQRDPLAVNMPSPSEEGEGGPLAVDEVFSRKNAGHYAMLNMRLRAQDLIRHGRTMQDMCNQTFSVAARDTFSKEEGFTLCNVYAICLPLAHKGKGSEAAER